MIELVVSIRRDGEEVAIVQRGCTQIFDGNPEQDEEIAEALCRASNYVYNMGD